LKYLYLLRHAKSCWDDPGVPDRERGLNKRGQRAAPAMGRALSQLLPAMALDVSPARRARLTLAGLTQDWPGLDKYPHRVEEALYTFSATEVLDWLSERDDGLDAVFIVGHNPAFTDLVNELVGQHVLDNLPTAGFASLRLEIDHWGDILQGDAVLERTLFPRQLEDQ